MALKIIVVNKKDESDLIPILAEMLGKIDYLVTKNDYLTTKINEMATKQERFDAILTKLDEVTTNIAGDYQTLIEEVRAGTVSDESLTRAEANVATLQELAASKENPIPGEVEETDETQG